MCQFLLLCFSIDSLCLLVDRSALPALANSLTGARGLRAKQQPSESQPLAPHSRHRQKLCNGAARNGPTSLLGQQADRRVPWGSLHARPVHPMHSPCPAHAQPMYVLHLSATSHACMQDCPARTHRPIMQSRKSLHSIFQFASSSRISREAMGP